MADELFETLFVQAEAAADRILESQPVRMEDTLSDIDREAARLAAYGDDVSVVADWVAVGMPDGDNYDANVGGTILQQVTEAMFFWYRQEIMEKIHAALYKETNNGGDN